MRARVSRVALALVAGMAAPAFCALAQSRIEKVLPLGPGGRFSLDTDLGSVTVTGAGAAEARVVVTSKRRDLNELLRFDFRQGPGSVSVSAKRKRGHFLPWIQFRGDSVHWEIHLPETTEIDIDTSGGAIRVSALKSDARLETSGGAIAVRDLVGDLNGHTSGGGIELERIEGTVRVETSGGGITGTELSGPVDADTSGGSVRLDRVAGDIRAHSSGGGIHLREAGGRVEADTSGGGIEATFARGNGHGGILSTSGGGIEVALDPTVGLRIEASGNSVRADVPITVQGAVSRGRLEGTMGGGGALLRLRTSGGGVRIHGI